MASNSLRDWLRQGTGRSTGPAFTNAAPPGWKPPGGFYAGFGGANFWDGVFASEDPFGYLIDWRRHPANRTRPVVGLDVAQRYPILTMPDSSVLFMGRPGTGKTSAGTVINGLLSPGPEINWSTRSDSFMATAMARGRMGEVWSLSARHGLPGAKAAYFSILAGCKDDWEFTKRSSDRLVRYPNLSAAARNGETGEQPFWAENSSMLLAIGRTWCANA